MIKRKTVVDNVVSFLNNRLTEACQTNPLMSFVRPYFARCINNNLYKIDKALKLVEDENGMVDIEGIIDDTISNLLVFENRKYPDLFGGLEIGNGDIKINIPFINKKLIINTDDIELFKQQLINK